MPHRDDRSGRDPDDQPPPATTAAKTLREYAKEERDLIRIVTDMRRYAPSKLHPLLIVARSMLNANTEDSAS